MKAVYGVILAIFLGSCSPFGLNPMGYEVLHEDLDTAWKRVSSMKYIPESAEHNPRNYWKSPIEFFNDGGGDCEDFAVALVYLLGPGAEVVVYGGSKDNCHAITYYKENYLEPQRYHKYHIKPTDILGKYSYNHIINYATSAYTKSIF